MIYLELSTWQGDTSVEHVSLAVIYYYYFFFISFFFIFFYYCWFWLYLIGIAIAMVMNNCWPLNRCWQPLTLH